MDEQALVNNIIKECTETNGFLTQLHSLRIFDEHGYRQLINNIIAYQNILGDKKEIDRKVAGCLFALQQELDNQVARLETGSLSIAKKKVIKNSHAEVLELIVDILTI